MDAISAATVVAAIAAVFAVLVSVYALRLQTRQNNLALGVNLLRELEQEFDYDMKNARMATAGFLLDRLDGKSTGALPLSALEILDHFYMLSMYLRKGVIDLEVTCITYFYWERFYYTLMQSDVESLSDLYGKSYCKDLFQLHSVLTNYARRHRAFDEKSTYTDQKVRQFLREEIEYCGATVVTTNPS
jgi:hypothetical protein